MNTFPNFFFRCTAIIAILSFFPSCGTVDIKLPGNRFETPEARGQWAKGSVHAGIGGSANHELVPSITATPPRVDQRTIRDSQLDPRVDGRLGLQEQVDLTVRLANDAPTTAGVKVQVYGAPEMKAKHSNLSVSITAAAGFGSETQREKTFLASTESKYHGTYTLADLGLIAGYRITDTSLLYGGPFVTKLWVSGAVNQPADSSFQYAVTGQGLLPGFHFGGQLDQDLVLVRLEVAYLSPSYTGANHRNLFSVGGQMGIRW